MIEKEKVAVIVGPTAVGKTAVSIRTADILGAEIISGDSMQVYRGMDIGTAKIREEEMYAPSGKKIPHHMIDIVDPDEAYSAADFQEMVRKTITMLNKEGKLPLIVGGTGLYINAVLDPYNFIEMDIDEKYRQGKWEEAEKYGSHFLHKELADIDREAAERIHPHDTKRIIRALEIYHQTKKTVSELQKAPGESSQVYQVVLVGLFMERDLLYQRINRRVDQMIDSGLIDEVKNLLKKGYHPCFNSMQGLGYRQVAAYLNGILTKNEAINLIKRDTRRFAKRQFTWFKRDERIKWFNLERYENEYQCAREIADYIGRSLGIAVE